jgi:hypothetical protein
LNSIKKIAIVVILVSVVIGSAFGLIASSSTPKNQQVSITARVISLNDDASCPNVPGNYSNWVQLQVNGNQTNLVLESLTALTPKPDISLTISLNSNESSFVYYDRNNSTSETISVPGLPYWAIGEDVDLTVTYYYGGTNPSGPTVLTVGSIPVKSGNLTC